MIARENQSYPKSSLIARMTTLIFNISVWPIVVFNFYNQTPHLGIAGIIFLSLLNLNYLFFYLRGNFTLWSSLALVFLGITSWYVFYTGGTHLTGYMWSFIFPLVAYEFLGHRRGLWALAFFSVG